MSCKEIKHEVTIEIPKKDVQELQSILNIKEGYYDQAGQFDTIETITANFGNGIEADIKIGNGDTPYVDPVLFENGVQVQVLDVEDDLLGSYSFEHEGVEYIVHLVEEGVAQPSKNKAPAMTDADFEKRAKELVDSLGDVFYDPECFNDEAYGGKDLDGNLSRTDIMMQGIIETVAEGLKEAYESGRGSSLLVKVPINVVVDIYRGVVENVFTFSNYADAKAKADELSEDGDYAEHEESDSYVKVVSSVPDSGKDEISLYTVPDLD